jgi:hypothetical protein
MRRKASSFSCTPPPLDEFSTQGRPSKRVGTGHEEQLLQIVPGELMRRFVYTPILCSPGAFFSIAAAGLPSRTRHRASW